MQPIRFATETASESICPRNFFAETRLLANFSAFLVALVIGMFLIDVMGERGWEVHWPFFCRRFAGTACNLSVNVREACGLKRPFPGHLRDEGGQEGERNHGEVDA